MELIRLNVEDGLDVERVEATEFDATWKVYPDYPVAKAARLYAGFAPSIGATERAMTILATLTEINQEDTDMATAKKAHAQPVKTAAKKASAAVANEAATHKAALRTGTKKETLPTSSRGKAQPASKKPEARKPAQPKPAPATKAKPEPKAKTAPAKAASREGTAADLFRELIRAGKLTDDAIFAKVQEKFGLDDSKRSYVGWYRNHLRKSGEKVPDPKK